jgi:hypothetical protein
MGLPPSFSALVYHSETFFSFRRHIIAQLIDDAPQMKAVLYSILISRACWFVKIIYDYIEEIRPSF